VRDDPRGAATRHAYWLTKAGQAALARWLTDPSEPVLEMRNETLLRLRFAGVLEPGQQLQIVRRMRAQHRQRAGELEAQLASGQFDDPFHRATIDFGLGWNTWADGWCASLERKLARRRSPAAST
jgi:Virulence activator alpha C-term